MRQINIRDDRGRDAMVGIDRVSIRGALYWVDSRGLGAYPRRLLRCTIMEDLPAIIARYGDGGVAEALIDSDPEIDTENFGRFLSDTSRVYLNSEGEIAHLITHWEIVHEPDGSEKEKRPQKVLDQNLSTEIPLTWTGRYLPKEEVYRHFVFAHMLQLKHINGLTYDFLYGIAKNLEERNSLVLLAGGLHGNEPLVMRRGATAYRGFLEGRTAGDRYALLLHLTNMELKVPMLESNQPSIGSR